VEVLCGVLVLGRIAAADMSAGKTDAQMNPLVAGLQTFFAAVGAGRDFFTDLVKVRALSTHLFSCGTVCYGTA
jgi:hypothetical protein